LPAKLGPEWLFRARCLSTACNEGDIITTNGDGLTGQARRGAERRQAILDAAIEVFSQRGFRGSALAEVADRVGLTPAGILYHFGSKEELLLAVLEERDRRGRERFVDLLRAGGAESLRRAVTAAAASETAPGLIALHTVLQAESFEPDAPAHDYVLDRSQVMRSSIQQALEANQRAGRVRADLDCAAKASEIHAFMEGAAVLSQLDDSVSLVELYRSYFRSLGQAIGASNSGAEGADSPPAVHQTDGHSAP
jgi:AcrR family transcriptional regulator